MQELTSRKTLKQRISGATKSDMALGAIAVAVTVVVLLVFAIIYIRPPDQRTISFQTTDSSAITTGQDVRVAGISVGKVSGIELGPDAVTVKARIDESTFVGDRSRVEVRMLTPVGGYAINLIPLGTEAAPDGVIAADRVTVPYSIGDVLQTVPDVTDEVDGDDVHANLDQVSVAMKKNPTSMREIVEGMESVTGILDRQRTQVHQIAALAAEYLQTFNANRGFVFELIRKIDIVVSTYNNTKVGFNETYRLLASALSRLRPLEKFYLENRDILHSHIADLRANVEDIQQHLGPAIDNLMELREQLAGWMTPAGMKQFGGGTLDLTDLCVPIAGRDC